jgi:hypothetical protein
MANPAPVIGEWYRRPGGETFEVVAIDADDHTIEIQYYDGTVEELELEEWLDDQIAVTEAPEDWRGSVDVEPEDYENEIEAAPGESVAWADPLQFVDRGEVGGYSEMELPEAPLYGLISGMNLETPEDSRMLWHPAQSSKATLTKKQAKRFIRLPPIWAGAV